MPAYIVRAACVAIPVFIVAAGLPLLWSAGPGATASLLTPVASAAGTTRTAELAALEALAEENPKALIDLALQRYDAGVRDYRCVFLKQERLGGQLTPVQHIRVLYRESPVSVYMKWEKNADQVKRALYIDRSDFVDDDGRKVAKVEPNGALIRLVVSEVEMPIHGDRARQTSRRSIDEFGFRSALALFREINALAERKGKLKLWYDGQGMVDGRPTFVIKRELPPSTQEHNWPDRLLAVHFDQEWLLPVAVHSFADVDGRQLLGSYVYTDVELNPGLGETAFKF